MFDFIRENQLDIMLGLINFCLLITCLLLITRFIPIRRRLRLILMEVVAAALLYFDRMAYIYSGDISQKGYIMVRVANFMVFFLTSGIVSAFNLYVMGMYKAYVKTDKIPIRLRIVTVLTIIGMLMVIVSQFTNLYYSFTPDNQYQRGPGFLLSYVIPVVCPIIIYTVIWQHRKYFSRFIFIALSTYVFMPIVMGIIQIFAYGISIVNMAMVVVSLALYVFTYLDINDEVNRAHKIEIENVKEQKINMQKLFEQTATAFVDAVEKRDPLSKGHSLRVANLAKKLAKENGKSEEECEEVYYTALLHNVGMVGIPDNILNKGSKLTEEENEIFKRQPVISSDILSGITVFPYLSRGVRYVEERYDGAGYPDGLKGKDIPEISRILSVADAYDAMKTDSRTSEPMPDPMIREEFLAGAGVKYDPDYADLMVHMIDSEIGGNKKKHSAVLEKELTCGTYRDTISAGIQVLQSVSKVSFMCECKEEGAGFFSAPSIILFDSYDSCVHNSEKSIEAYHYIEYAEVWFDGHIVSTRARNTKVDAQEKEPVTDILQTNIKSGKYEITAAKYEDHVRLKMESPTHSAEVIIA
ncbi:MAG: HD domain-containing protein, partial [Lachnospiraceae bacterium]|nr:HD domain-containing protein [Lachnospiraceae bacterium]